MKTRPPHITKNNAKTHSQCEQNPSKNLQHVDLYLSISFQPLSYSWGKSAECWGSYPRRNTWNLLRSKPEKNHPDAISSRLGKTPESKTKLDSVSLVDTAPRPEMPTTICCIQPIRITQTNIWHIIHSYIFNIFFVQATFSSIRKKEPPNFTEKHLKPSNRGTLRCTLVSP